MLNQLLTNSKKSPFYFPVASRKGEDKGQVITLFLYFPPTGGGENSQVDMTGLTENPAIAPEVFSIRDLSQAVATFAPAYPEILENINLWANGDPLSKTSPLALFNAGYLSADLYGVLVSMGVQSWADRNERIIPANMTPESQAEFMRYCYATGGQFNAGRHIPQLEASATGEAETTTPEVVTIETASETVS